MGVTSLTGEFLIPYILDTFEERFPHVELILMEERMVVLQELVKNGKADIAFVYQTDEPDLEYQMILENPVYLQIPPFFLENKKDWKPGISNPSISPEALSGQPLILLKNGRGMREVADRLLTQFLITPGKIIETENIHLARSLVHLNKGFTFVPSVAIRRLSQNSSQSFYCQVKDYPMKRSLYCCYRKYGYLTEAERFLVRLIPEIL